MKGKWGVLSAILAVLFFVGTAVPVRAVDRDDDKCQHQVEKAQRNLDKAVAKHGEHSEQAEKRRHQLEEARERCHHDHDDHH